MRVVRSPKTRALYAVLVYRFVLAEDVPSRITTLATGVSGISPHAPALSVASRSGRVVFSVFEQGGYNIYALGADSARGMAITRTAADPAPAGALPLTAAVGESAVSRFLDDPRWGLPAPQDFRVTDYSPSLRLEYLGPPTVGLAVSEYARRSPGASRLSSVISSAIAPRCAADRPAAQGHRCAAPLRELEAPVEFGRPG